MISEQTQQLGERRAQANSFFLALNTAIVGVIAILIKSDTNSIDIDSYINNAWFLCTLTLLGTTASLVWALTIARYRMISSVRFSLILLYEDVLPSRPFKAEWEILSDKSQYRGILLTTLEMILPTLFLFGYLVSAALVIFSVRPA